MTNKPSFKQIQTEFAAHIRDPEKVPANDQIEERRLAIYRNLFINSISGLLAGSFPVIRSLYTEDDWKALVRLFYRKEHNKTPHFPEIPREFVEYLKNNEADSSKPFLYELAHYEWIEIHLEKNNTEISKTNTVKTDDFMNHKPVVSPLVKLQAYQYPVHQIKASNQPDSKLPSPLFMLIWRDCQYRVNFSELKPFSALLLETLINNEQQSGQALLETLGKQYQQPDISKFTKQGLQTIEKWYQQDIIIATEQI